MYIHKGKLVDTIGGSKVINCTQCHFKHIFPLPTDAQLRMFYKKEFYQKEKPNYFKENKRDSKWWKATYDNRYDLLESHTKGRKILDIGSGPGQFLITGKRRGWQVVGIEPSSTAAIYSSRRGLTMINDFFSYQAVKKYGLFDVVNVGLVFEHVSHPDIFIGEIKKLLKPRGLILIISPNDYNPLQMVLRDNLKFKPWWVVPKHHLNYFTTASMSKFLEKYGFKVLEMSVSFPMEFFLLSGDNYVSDPDLGKICHERRKKFELTLFKHHSDILNSMYSSYAKQGIGREFIILAKNANL